MKKMRLDRYLANCGVGSRKEVKSLIKEGCVFVDDISIKDPGYFVIPTKTKVIAGGQKIEYKEFIYLMMNKPPGVISATTDKRHTTVIDLLPEPWLYRDLFPAGRLDKDTEGLLVLTNDGILAHRLLSPKKQVPKTYYAVINGLVTIQDIQLFEQGIQLEDNFTTLPAELSILESGQESRVNLTIYEGKFHQVKRMFEAVGKRVTYLKRISMGALKLDESLELGEARELKEEELILLKNSTQ